MLYTPCILHDPRPSRATSTVISVTGAAFQPRPRLRPPILLSTVGRPQVRVALMCKGM